MNCLRTLSRGLLILCLVLFATAAVRSADNSAIPQRGDIDDKYKWRVEDIYGTIDAWEADFVKLQAGLTGYDQYRGHLGDSPPDAAGLSET